MIAKESQESSRAFLSLSLRKYANTHCKADQESTLYTPLQMGQRFLQRGLGSAVQIAGRWNHKFDFLKVEKVETLKMSQGVAFYYS